MLWPLQTNKGKEILPLRFTKEMGKAINFFRKGSLILSWKFNKNWRIIWKKNLRTFFCLLLWTVSQGNIVEMATGLPTCNFFICLGLLKAVAAKNHLKTSPRASPASHPVSSIGQGSHRPAQIPGGGGIDSEFYACTRREGIETNSIDRHSDNAFSPVWLSLMSPLAMWCPLPPWDSAESPH